MNSFRQDVYNGLKSSPKRLSSRYFYDDIGDQLFQKIMQSPEYYLPETELEILKNHSSEIAEYLIHRKSDFEIVELGAGDGSKTIVFLRELFRSELEFIYRPLDISRHILESNQQFIRSKLPDIRIKAVVGNFFETLGKLDRFKSCRMTLFMGSNIGNFKPEGAIEFLRFISNQSLKGDLFLIAFDLKKDPNVILNAYNDKQGLTAQFNLNLLKRINRELGADFDVETFFHYPTYNPVSGVTSSFLISKKAQIVHFCDGCSFEFKMHEPIHMEVSCKYDVEQIRQLAHSVDLKIKKWWTDSRNYYGLALMEKD